MFLKPWSEGANFKRNIIDKVLCWIRLVDVPDIFWCKEGLSSIASTVGKPMKFDAATAKFEPMKYAGVQVELSYSGLRPDFVRVPLPNSNEEAKIEIQYGELPYSCSLCCAFGHSLSRCINNPDRVVKKPRTQAPKTSNASTSNSARNTQPATEPQTTSCEENCGENCDNNAIVPYQVGTFLGCPVVRDADVEIHDVDNRDDLDEFDKVNSHETGETGETEETEEGDLPSNVTGNAFQPLADCDEILEEGEFNVNEEEQVPQMPTTIYGRKRDRSQETSKPPVQSRPVVIALGTAAQMQNLSSKLSSPDKDGFTPVINKKSLRLASRSAKNNL